MATSYPSALDTVTKFPVTVEDDWDSTSGSDLGTSTTVGFLAQWMRDAGGAIVAVETELGTTPKGTFANVSTRLNARGTMRKSADQTFTTTTLANVTDMSFAVAASQDYYFKFVVMFQSTTTTSGIGLGVTCPASPTGITYAVSIYSAAAGTAGAFQGVSSASGTAVLTTAAVAANTNYTATIEGILSNGANAGTLQLQARQGGGTAANQVVKKGTYGEWYLN